MTDVFFAAAIGVFVGGALFFLCVLYWRKRTALRLKMLTEYLEKINTGSPGVLLEASEDDFSKLQDEIYKTVTMLYQARDSAVDAKNNFADNLSNIAHQMKTPVTALSLSLQMMRENPSPESVSQMEKQLKRLTHLQESLLFMARIDAGTLRLERTAVDVFTLLVLAAENLQELSAEAGVLIAVPENEEATVFVDMDWTMEAMMNLMKNCMEHSKSGQIVHCSFEKNPLYVQIKIWDEGSGFSKEDIPHLFERFYRGRDAKDGSIGIGLSLTKSLIEMQNGTISAYNVPGGGACFDICFYSH